MTVLICWLKSKIFAGMRRPYKSKRTVSARAEYKRYGRLKTLSLQGWDENRLKGIY
ncbi:hypothetical protein [Argonema galeatum]|uniref:hypothetical protein n=1 Tax=Argonema galeatum TaxID=2942762 RepID=UPI002011ABE5|nr:hypothetical protein [Argonema galeatum]